ncbi:MAG: RNA polymerase sigma-70 factor [Bacteroidales bacterium]|nr:RNA polymerase sigma-70 factor [Bacteroidales bacterium]
MHKEEKKIISQLKKDHVGALKYLFDTYYEKLYFFAITFINQKEIAEEIVQDVFISIWDKRKELIITSSLKSYLFASVKYKSFSCLRQRLESVTMESEQVLYAVHSHHMPDQLFETFELEYYIQKAISLLPDKCKIIFNLSRNSGLTYKEIAYELNISVETVKTQISIALKKIKIFLEIHWDTVLN